MYGLYVAMLYIIFSIKTGADVVIILKLNGVNFELFVVAKTGSK